MKNVCLFPLVAYTALQLISNISSIKVGFVFNFAVDMGVFLYPFTFTLRDLVHKEIGKEQVRKFIFYTALLNLLMVLYFYFISFFDTDTSVKSSAVFDECFSPVWRLVVFSILAQLISELVDTEIYHIFVKKFEQKHKWARVLASNSVSIPIDNLIFCFGAFAFTYDLKTIYEIFVFNLIVKYFFSIVSIPLIYIGKNDND